MQTGELLHWCLSGVFSKEMKQRRGGGILSLRIFHRCCASGLVFLFLFFYNVPPYFGGAIPSGAIH